jgi:hypothetical protein
MSSNAPLVVNIEPSTTGALTSAQVIRLDEKYGAQYGVNPNLLYAQDYAESGLDPNAVSSAGAEGIAQFMPATAAEFGINPFNPQQAIQAQAEYMAQLIKQNGGNVTAALNQYNGNNSGSTPTAYSSSILQNVSGSGTGTAASSAGSGSGCATGLSITDPSSWVEYLKCELFNFLIFFVGLFILLYVLKSQLSGGSSGGSVAVTNSPSKAATGSVIGDAAEAASDLPIVEA